MTFKVWAMAFRISAFWVWLMTFKVWAMAFRTTRILASLEAAPEPETLATRRELSSCLASLSLAVSSALGFPRRSEALTLVILSVQSKQIFVSGLTFEKGRAKEEIVGSTARVQK